MTSTMIIPEDTRDITPLLIDADGRLGVRNAAFYRQNTNQDERSLFCVRTGAYILPTDELVGFLRFIMAGRKTIEIGSGNGVLARALDVQATDSHQQERPEMATLYAMAGQAPVSYGRNVERLDALAAVAKYRPEVVIGAWVTHLDGGRQTGNLEGIDEGKVIAGCDTYIMVGNRHTHRHKPIWSLPHKVIEPDWLYSRAFSGPPDYVAVWGNTKGFPA